MKLELQSKIICRFPAFPIDAQLKEFWTELLEAIKISSPSFYNVIKDYNEEQLNQIPASGFYTIWKYFNRAKFRSTPYGHFAGFAIYNQESGTDENMTISNKQQFHILPDWSYKDDIGLNNHKIRNSDLIFCNSSYYVVSNIIRYVSHFDGQFQLSEVTLDNSVLEVLTLCEKPRAYDSLFEDLPVGSVQLKAAKRLVNDMLSLQLLISDKQPNVIGEDYFKRIKWPPPATYNPYIIAERKIISGGIAQKHLKGLPSLINALHTIRPKGDRPTLDNFKSRFSKRFEGMEVPLMQALDPETGIGYDDLEQATTTDTFNIPLTGKQAGSNAADKAAIEKSFIHYFASAFDHSRQVVELKDLKLPPVKVKYPLPNTLSVMAMVTNDMIWIDQIGGVSANSLSGRFTQVSEEVLELCRANAKIEADANPDVLFFDIAYMAETNVDNISRRKSIYDYQLSILNYDTSDHPLLLNDLLLKIQENELILFSKKLNKRMVPRIASAYNYQRSDLPVFRLLCDLQHQQIQTNLNLDIQALVPDLSFYPRIQYQQFVLSPARWKVSYKEITGNEKQDGYLKSIKAYLRSMSISRQFKTGIGDQTLCFDQEQEEDMIAFAFFLRRQESIYIEEAPFLNNSPVTNEANRPYSGQFILSVTHNEKVYKAYRKPITALASQMKIIPIGKDWLYFEIYCHTQRADEILQQKIIIFLKSHRKLIKVWFFIRYNENGNHIRLRINLNDQRNGYLLITALSTTLDTEINSGIIADLQLKTYVRETERYGGDLISDIEKHFCCDSAFVLQVLQQRFNPNTKYQLCHELINFIKKADVLTATHFTETVEMVSASFNKEHELKPDDFSKINQEYKTFDNEPLPKLSFIQQKSFDLFKNSFVSILQNSDPALRPNLFTDMLHMHVNRLFNQQQRSHEMLIYYYYCKELKRQTKIKSQLTVTFS
jgi:thiopeptide-type bacteriocin biosynthesis protein